MHERAAGETQSLLERASLRAEDVTHGATTGIRAAWRRIPKPQLGAILALWAVFLVSQRQKSKHHHCTWEYGVWFAVQVWPEACRP